MLLNVVLYPHPAASSRPLPSQLPPFDRSQAGAVKPLLHPRPLRLAAAHLASLRPKKNAHWPRQPPKQTPRPFGHAELFQDLAGTWPKPDPRSVCPRNATINEPPETNPPTSPNNHMRFLPKPCPAPLDRKWPRPSPPRAPSRTPRLCPFPRECPTFLPPRPRRHHLRCAHPK